MPIITTGPGTLYTTTASTATTLTWGAWNQAWTTIGTTTGSYWVQWNVNYTEARPAVLTPEELQRAQEDLERAREESRRLAETAWQNAEQLLTALLTDEQNATWREHSYFTVRGSSSGRTYRIRRGIAGNVDLMAEYEDAAEVTYCAHPPGIPAADVCLAQLFLLCTDEDAFLAVANVHQRYRVRQRPELRAVA
jgi:hypothetical protein